MKKIMILMMIMSAAAMASVKVASVKVLASSIVLVALGGLALPGLVVGDAQWQAYTNKGVCDSSHTIYTLAPQLKDGVLGKIQLATLCSDWYPLNERKK